jgi:hypothetical protein
MAAVASLSLTLYLVATLSEIALQFPTLVRHADGVELSAHLGNGRSLKISVHAPLDLVDRLAPTMIPFIPMAMLIAGKERAALNIAASVDDGWWLNLMGSYWPLMKRLFDFEDVRITRGGGGSYSYPMADDVALMFSAGIDSLYSLKKMREIGVRPKWFVNINAGAHDFDRACWSQRLALVKDVAREVGVRLVVVDTNFHELFSAAHIHCHPVRNLSAAYSLFPAIGRYVYSSSGAISYESAQKYGVDYLDVVSSTITPSPISLSILGWDAERIQKIAAMADEPLAPRFLDVCTNQHYQGKKASLDPINCGLCPKCIRTMLTLDHFGLLNDYNSQFPLENFRDNREKFIHSLSQQTDPLDLAIINLLQTPRHKNFGGADYDRLINNPHS